MIKIVSRFDSSVVLKEIDSDNLSWALCKEKEIKI
jgi:hypothetical protein